MTHNPFLSMNEPCADALNPFMMTDAAPDELGGDNPFAASNPFCDFGGGYEPPVGDTVPADIFGGAEPPGVGAKHFDVFAENSSIPLDIFARGPADTEKAAKPTDLDLVSMTTDQVFTNETDFKGPQLPSRPLPPETQNLILSVTGQMEFTSSHLLDRIPLTRTPSPVSVRDMHSPSPTPELEAAAELDHVAADSFDINRNKPARPPPARPPPPRAAPPAPAPSHNDDINLFDAPVPAAVKPTKEAILSLYSAPKQEVKPIDFLSDDLLDDMPIDSPHAATALFGTEASSGTATPGAAPARPCTPGAALPSAFPAPVDCSTENADIPMDCSEPRADVISSANSFTSPFAEVASADIGTPRVGDTEMNPFESTRSAETATTAVDPVGNIFSVKSEPARDVVMSLGGDIFENAFDSTSDKEFDAQSDINVFEAAPIDAFGSDETKALSEGADALAPGAGAGAEPMALDGFPDSRDAFDAFSAKFESAFANNATSGAWGEVPAGAPAGAGFEAEAFDEFLSLGAPAPRPGLARDASHDSGDDCFSVVIRPKEGEATAGGEEAAVPALAPPPRPQAPPESPRLNPFDKTGFELPGEAHCAGAGAEEGSGPPTPLFDEDVSLPLEDFPRTKYDGPGWEMHLRQPNKKKITGQRFWKKVFVRVTYQGDSPVVQLRGAAGDREPFQELPLQACYSVSDVGAQQFDQFGKIFTVKLQYVFYKERPGVRPGQVTKAERITTKLSQFAAYAIQGDYQGVKEFGSDLRKLGLPVEHAPQVSQLFKLGSLSFEDVKQFSCCVEEALFRLAAHRDRALTYKMEEVQITAVDELYVEQDAEGSVLKQIARVRLFFLGFLSGMPDVELGVNDLRRQGREVVGRHDIIPVVTEEWIRVEDAEFHACVQPDEFADTQIIKFKPPDACYIELMRFRVRPPKNRELPLQLKAQWCVAGNKVELRADALVPGFASRKLGQVPCEDVAVRFPIPDCWIYLFRVEKHFRYGSVKSAHRRTGKIKGIERLLGAVDALQESLIEVTSGHAKYEHQHRAIVWRMPRLPKEGQGAYTTHNLVCRMALTSYDQVPAELARHAHVEFTMPATQVSHMTVRSVSLQNHDGDPPEKYVRYLARHEYIVGIERTSGQAAPAYALATAQREAAAPAHAPAPANAPAHPAPPSSDSDSD